MHELSIASQIWESVAKAASEHGARRVKSVVLEIGALNLIEEEQLRFWIQALAERAGSPCVKVAVTTLRAAMEIRVVSAEIETEGAEGTGGESSVSKGGPCGED